MQLILQIPDDLAAELRPRKERLPRILSRSLRELDAEGAAGFSGLADLMEFLASLPTPEQIIRHGLPVRGQAHASAGPPVCKPRCAKASA